MNSSHNSTTRFTRARLRFITLAVLLTLACVGIDWKDFASLPGKASAAANAASVATSRQRFGPDDRVIINGADWQPGEMVTLVLHQEPVPVPDVTLYQVAASNGVFTNLDFVSPALDPQENFRLITVMATGQSSGFTAQTQFVDGPRIEDFDASCLSQPNFFVSGDTVCVKVRGLTQTVPAAHRLEWRNGSGILVHASTSSNDDIEDSFPVDFGTWSLRVVRVSDGLLRRTSAFHVCNNFDDPCIPVTLTNGLPSASDVTTQTDPGQCGTRVDYQGAFFSFGAPLSCFPFSSSFFASGSTPVTCLQDLDLGIVNFGFRINSATFTVTVNDNQPPAITLNGASTMNVECHTDFTDPGASASDNCGQTAVTTTGGVNANTPGTYHLSYDSTDDTGNHAQPVTRTVRVVDTIAPQLSLNGANPMTVEACTAFIDPGATASDGCAGNLTSQVAVTGSVNPSVVGSYTLTYTISDGANQSIATRLVKVVDTTPAVISGMSANPAAIWPPNKKMVNVAVNYVVSDTCGPVNTALSLTSNEPTSAGDMVVINPHLVSLRADRAGSGNGRIYTIKINATDSFGNVSSRNVTVKVPHDQGN